MRCLRINIRQACFIVLAILINRSQMEDNGFTQPSMFDKKNITFDKENSEKITVGDLILRCPSDTQCKDLNEPCIACELNNKCHYGELVNTTCRVAAQVNCRGPTQFPRTYTCRYCYQTDHWEHSCELLANCNSVAAPRSLYVTNCTVKDDILCLGLRKFKKRILCNWTGGYRWAVSLALSISLGGFGADRFYLGHWQEGIGKLFSFGGLGVWTIIDVILISLHYLGPADGSLYI